MMADNDSLISAYIGEYERVNGRPPHDVHYSRGYFYVQGAAKGFKTPYRRGELEQAYVALSQRQSYPQSL